MRGCLPIFWFFFEPPPPPTHSKPMPSMRCSPLTLKWSSPCKKQSPPLKRKKPFHEMIPRKSTINNNLKSSQNPWKICVKKFIFSKFAGLQAYSWQLYYHIYSFTSIFWQHFRAPLPLLPPCIDLSPPIKFWRAPPHPPPPLCSQYLWETLIYPLKMTHIKNRHLPIQVSQNQSLISFQLSMKMIITFCSVWTFFW